MTSSDFNASPLMCMAIFHSAIITRYDLPPLVPLASQSGVTATSRTKLTSSRDQSPAAANASRSGSQASARSIHNSRAMLSSICGSPIAKAIQACGAASCNPHAAPSDLIAFAKSGAIGPRPALRLVTPTGILSDRPTEPAQRLRQDVSRPFDPHVVRLVRCL